MGTENELQQETRKWEDKLRNRLEQVEPVDQEGEGLLENARAYHDDVEHFREQDDWIRAFEAVIWGWSWLEIGERLEKLREQ